MKEENHTEQRPTELYILLRDRQVCVRARTARSHTDLATHARPFNLIGLYSSRNNKNRVECGK